MLRYSQFTYPRATSARKQRRARRRVAVTCAIYCQAACAASRQVQGGDHRIPSREHLGSCLHPEFTKSSATPASSPLLQPHFEPYPPCSVASPPPLRAPSSPLLRRWAREGVRSTTKPSERWASTSSDSRSPGVTAPVSSGFDLLGAATRPGPGPRRQSSHSHDHPPEANKQIP